MHARLGLALGMALAAACDSSGGATGGSDAGPDSTFEPDAPLAVTSEGGEDDASDVGVDSPPDAGAEGFDDTDDAPNGATVCHGVCAGAYFGCARTYATTFCPGKVCCELPVDGGPPTLDGGCLTSCASPDDIGCPGTWYRSSDCLAPGVLCCGPRLPGYGTDGG